MRWFVVAVLVLLAVCLALLVLPSRSQVAAPPPEETLEPIVESPRPPVIAEAPVPTLRGSPMPGRPSGRSAQGRAALLKERNDLAREHRRLVAAYEAGVAAIQDVEAAELLLLDARHRLGEIDVPTWHRGRVVLLARAVGRASLAVEAGMIPPHDRDRLRVFMELDRMLARDANEYEATRSAYLAAHQEWLAARVEAGVEAPKDAEREMSSERDDFPPAEEARARDR